MEPPILAALIGGCFLLIGLFVRRWFEISASRPKAAAAFLKKCKIGHSALAGELGISLKPDDVATLKEHLWFWQAAKVSRMYRSILDDEERTDSYRKKVTTLHDYVSHLI